MIGVILAAGKGNRLGELAKGIPKSLLKLNNNETILNYNLNVLEKLDVDKTFIVTGFGALKIEEHVATRSNVHCIYNPFWNYCNVLGSLFMALPFIDDDFLFLHADTLVEYRVWRNLLSYDGEIVLPYKRKSCGEEEMKVKHDASGKLVEISKLINPSEADGEFLGIAKFKSSFVSYFNKVSENLLKNDRLDIYMEAAVQKAIDEQKDIRTFDIGNSIFIEVDFPEDYENAKLLFSSVKINEYFLNK